MTNKSDGTRTFHLNFSHTATATITATYNGTTVTLNKSFRTVGIYAVGCGTCSVTGGSNASFGLALIDSVSYGGLTVQITSNNAAVVPNQTSAVAAGAVAIYPNVSTNAVSASTSVNVRFAFNGTSYTQTLTVTP